MTASDAESMTKHQAELWESSPEREDGIYEKGVRIIERTSTETAELRFLEHMSSRLTAVEPPRDQTRPLHVGDSRVVWSI